MPRPWKIYCTLFLTIFLISHIQAAEKKSARIVRIGDSLAQEVRFRQSLVTADTCLVRHDSGAVWKIDGWVIGNELYKEYLDPAASCPQPYPFTVTEIAMQMYFMAPTPLNVSVDIEDVDATDPTCPVPGNLLAISSEYSTQVPGQGLYEIWVPLDTPYVVNGPFFAGFYIANALDSSVGPAVICDSFPVYCTSYNIWNDSIGFIDLNNNQFWNFPGRLLLYASGIEGGSGGYQPPPALRLLAPGKNDTVYGSVDLWAWDTSGSSIIDYVSFAYSSGGGYTEIGRDYDGMSPLRDGVHDPGGGDGFSLLWDFSSIPEGTYTLRATAYDTLGRSSADSVVVYLEPTPPVPTVVSPDAGDDFCSPVQLLMTCNDEDVSVVEVHRKDGQIDFSLGLPVLNQSSFGDANGNPLDGNHASGGEFGDYYCGPVAAALAVKVWFDRGYTNVMKEGFSIISLDTLVERLAEAFHTRDNLGTYDENLWIGLHEYLQARGNEIAFDYFRNPDYFLLRTWLEEEERTVILGLNGLPATWLAVDGFSDWQQSDGSYLVRISDPLTGSLLTVPMRHAGTVNELYYNGTWQRVEIMVSLLAKTWNVTRQLIGADMNGSDGWSFSWTPSGLTEDAPSFFRSIGRDASGLSGSTAILLRYNCSQSYVPGDYDNDGNANIFDLTYLIHYLTQGGDPPVGGAWRADANCDQSVNIADVVYYMNYLFGTAGAPCY